MNSKAEKEKAAAEDVRKREMESLSENKRRSDAGRDDITSSKPKKARNTGTETVAFLREKTLRDSELKKAEL